MSKRLVAEAAGLGALVLSGYFLVQAYWPGAHGIDYQSQPKPYVVYRDRITEKEKIVVQPCVPIETVVPKEGATVPNSGSMFPLYLGDLKIGNLPYGGKIQTGLREGTTGAGVVYGTVVPNPIPKWEWYGDLSADLAAGKSIQGGLKTEGGISYKLFRYRRMTLGLSLKGEASEREGSDLSAMVKASFALNHYPAR